MHHIPNEKHALIDSFSELLSSWILTVPSGSMKLITCTMKRIIFVIVMHLISLT